MQINCSTVEYDKINNLHYLTLFTGGILSLKIKAAKYVIILFRVLKINDFKEI